MVDTSSSPNANLQSPLSLGELATPSSQPFPTRPPQIEVYSPDLPTTLQELTLGSLGTMSNFQGNFRALPVGRATPRYNETTAVTGYLNSFAASLRLQRAIGLDEPVPYANPPPAPEELDDKLREGLKCFGNRNTRGDVERNPVKVVSTSDDQTPHTGVCTSSRTKKKVRFAENVLFNEKARGNECATVNNMFDVQSGVRMSFLESDSEEVNIRSSCVRRTSKLNHLPSKSTIIEEDTVSLASTAVGDDTPHSSSPAQYRGLGSNVTLVGGQQLGEANPAIQSQLPNPAASRAEVSIPTHELPSSPIPEPGTDLPKKSKFRRLSSIAKLRQRFSGILSNATGPNLTNSVYKAAASRSAPVLFPPPGLKTKRSWVDLRFGGSSKGKEKSTEKKTWSSGVEIPQTETAIAESPMTAILENQPQQAHQAVPGVVISEPAPNESIGQRKRAPSTSADDIFGPPLTKRRDGNTVGFPALPLIQWEAWRTPFPGNTKNLVYCLLTWHSKMRVFYGKLGPETMKLHPMFPYEPSMPVNVPMISISFWDTGVEPHKELRFIGPGDVADMYYGEVDTFSKCADISASTRENLSMPVVSAESKQHGYFRGTPSSDREMHRREDAGDGRWVFLMIRGHKHKPDKNEPHHLMLAFPKSAVTGLSNNALTVFHDATGTPPARDPIPNPRLNHLRQGAPQRKTMFNAARLYETLRSANTATLPEREDEDLAKAYPGTSALNRTTLVFGKAGYIPLIEGYRTDVGPWKPVLDAMARGEGKAMIFSERMRKSN